MNRTPWTTILLLAFTVVAALGVSACRPDFAPYNRLTSLRVMAVKSNPPAPATGNPAMWSALVYTLPDDPAPTYAWSWCPFTGGAADGYPCTLPDGSPLDDTILASLLTAAETAAGVSPGQPPPPLNLGTDPTVMLTNSIDPGVLGALCMGKVPGVPKQDCSNGFPFRIKVIVQTTGTHADTVVAVATGHWLFDPATASNENPTITKLTATLAGMDPQDLTEDAALTLPRDFSTPINALVPMDASQTYTGLDDNQQPAQLTERLFLTWFVESGGTQYPRTSYYPASTTLDDLQKNHWSPALAKDYAPSTARIVVVIHDSRGGVDWAQGVVNLDPTP